MTTSSIDQVQRPRVCVIGAGPAGLAAGRLLRDEGCDVTVLEKSLGVGGVWRYNPEPSREKGPMYRSLVTNLPKECMAFFSLPFREDLQSFVTRDQMLDYLRSYVDEHKLHQIIHLGCPVETVRRVATTQSCPEDPRRPGDGQSSGSRGTPSLQETDGTRQYGDGRGSGEDEEGALGKWEVVYHRTGSNNGAPPQASSRVSEEFDAVCVCNGHFDKPSTPRTEGADQFRGTVMHARQYDRPGVEAFIGKRVLVVGAGYSGADVAREVSSVADVVHVSDRNNQVTLQGGERGNIWWRPALERFEGDNGIRFKDGKLEEVDTVVWCTGYSYSFPFLEGSGLLTAPVSERVHPLYEQLFHARYPSLSFIGLPQKSIVQFPLFEVQANTVAAVVSGRGALPRLAEREQWLRDEEQSLRERSVDPASRGAHVLATRQWAYERRLLRIASGPGVVARVSGKKGTGEDKPEAAMQAMSKALDVIEAINDDADANRTRFPGGPDDFRLREYKVDWESGRFSVSYADRKANGERPSARASQ
eukprot:g1680.t1